METPSSGRGADDLGCYAAGGKRLALETPSSGRGADDMAWAAEQVAGYNVGNAIIGAWCR